MKAIEAGSEAGGDKRCGEQRAQSAFMKVAKLGDNSKNPYLDLVIKDLPKGGENPVVLFAMNMKNGQRKALGSK